MERFADVFDQAQAHIEQETALAIDRIRLHAVSGRGRMDCIECGASIPARRRQHVPNAQRCAPCQERLERQGPRGHAL